jgi:hypothetical protein
MKQIANNSNTALGQSAKTFDGHGASVQPMSRELVGKTNHKQEGKE